MATRAEQIGKNIADQFETCNTGVNRMCLRFVSFATVVLANTWRALGSHAFIIAWLNCSQDLLTQPRATQELERVLELL